MTHPSPDDDLTPSPTPTTTPGASLFRAPSFSQPTPTPGPLPPSPDPGRFTDPRDDYEDVAPSESGTSSAIPSTDRSTGSAKRKALRKTMREAVKTAGGVVHQLLTRNDPVSREAGVWVPDKEDRDAIAEPLAGLASRRAPAAVTDNPDVTDLLELGAALLAYVVKSLGARADAHGDAQAYYEPPAAGQGDPADRDPLDLDALARLAYYEPPAAGQGDPAPFPLTENDPPSGPPDVGDPADLSPGRVTLGRRVFGVQP